jgi:MoxR-like ATPase
VSTKASSNLSGKKPASAANTLVGRSDETSQVLACLKAKRNVLLEGPVGVGKTHLALSVTESLGRKVFRVDGDNRYSEQKLSGWFDPPTVIKKGFSPDAFVPGPLVEAMQQGGVLFINELNRLPEGVQNVLLPAIDERMILVPKLGAIIAKDGFLVVATQNPKEFVATSHLSEAVLDRFELVVLDYQSEEEEIEIVSKKIENSKLPKPTAEKLSRAAVLLARMTRGHERIRRGASVRAAIAVAEIAAVLIEEGEDFAQAFLKAVLMALPTRIEIELEAESDRSMREEVEALLKSWAQEVLDQLSGTSRKK